MIIQFKQAIVLDPGDQEDLRQYKHVLAALFPADNKTISDITSRSTSVVALFKSFIAANNDEYLGISLDAISMRPYFNHAATVLLQYALAQKKYECVQKIVTYYDKLVETPSPRKELSIEEEPINLEWSSIFRTLWQQDDMRMVCAIVEWIIKAAPIDPTLYLGTILNTYIYPIINSDEGRSAQELEKIVKILQAVAASNGQKYASIINDLLSSYVDHAIFWRKYHSVASLLNHGVCPSAHKQCAILEVALAPSSFPLANAEVKALQQDRPELFQRLVAICQEKQAAFQEEQVALWRAQQQAQLQNWSNTLNGYIEQADVASIKALCLSTPCTRALLPIIESALLTVEERKRNVIAHIVQVQSARTPESSSKVQSLRESAQQLEHIRSSLIMKQAQCQYATN